LSFSCQACFDAEDLLLILLWGFDAEDGDLMGVTAAGEDLLLLLPSTLLDGLPIS
jgi:hypothetical protein